MTPPAADASKRISEAAPNQTTNAHHAHHRDVVEGCELSSSLSMGIPQLRATIGGLRAWISLIAVGPPTAGRDYATLFTSMPTNVPHLIQKRTTRVTPPNFTTLKVCVLLYI